MKTFHFRTALFISVIFAFAVTSAAAQKKATIHGDIVELTSYVKDGLKPTSSSKKEVVLQGVKRSGTFAIVEKATSKLYILGASPSDTSYMKNVTPYLGVKSFVKGTLYTRGGIKMIMLEDIGKSLK